MKPKVLKEGEEDLEAAENEEDSPKDYKWFTYSEARETVETDSERNALFLSRK